MLNVSGLKPLNTDGLKEVGGLNVEGLKPLDASGLKEVKRSRFPALPASELDRVPGDIYEDAQGRILEWTEDQGLQHARYESLHPKQTQQPLPDSDQGRLASAGSGFMQGLGQLPSSVLKAHALSDAPPAEVWSVIEQMDMDSNAIPMLRDPTYRDILERYRTGTDFERAEIKGQLEDRVRGAMKSRAYQAGEDVDNWFRENFETNPKYADEFWSSKVPQALGSATSFLLSGLLTRGAASGATPAIQSAAPALMMGGLGSAANKVEVFEDALNSGASIGKAVEASQLAELVGTTEAIPLSNMMERLDAGTGGAMTQYIKRALREGTEEAVQESFVEIMNASIAKGLYDPERGVWTDEALEAGGAGFVTGAILETLMTLAIPGKRSKGRASEQNTLPTEEQDHGTLDPEGFVEIPDGAVPASDLLGEVSEEEKQTDDAAIETQEPLQEPTDQAAKQSSWQEAVRRQNEGMRGAAQQARDSDFLKALDEKYSDYQGEKPADNKMPGLSASREAPLPKAGEPVPPAGQEPAQATRPVQKPQEPGQAAPTNEAPNGESILGDENRRSFDSLKLPVADINLSKDVPNFKAGANESGVVEPLGGTFDDTGVAPIIVWQRKNGDYEVVSGRHRLDLAKRSGTKEIDAQVFREVDGYNREWAKQIDAELNIRDENGEVRDYANYFRARGESRESAEAKSLLSRRKGRDGFDIAEGATDLLFESLQAEETSERAAAEISRKAPRNEALQAMAMQQLKAGKGLNTALGMIEAVQAMQAAGRVKQSDQGDLFGMDDSAMKEAEQMAKDANKIRNQIRSQINSAKGASKNPAAAKKLGVDVKDPDAVRKKLTELEALAKRWENWPTDRELREQLSGATEQAPQAEPQESKPKPQDSPKPAPQAETKPPALELSAQTEAELAAADAKKKANEAKAKEAERKQKIQDQADDFALTDPGMNQEQAELEARGQTNLFDQPEPAKAKEPQAPGTPIEAAASETNTNPTQGQIEAGNYRKGTVQLHGLTIAIENPKGSTRSGVDPDGKAWETTMNQHYGYIKSTKGADGEAVDVFLGPNAEDASYPVFVIDQVDASGKFDEHKVMLGFRNQKQARDAYKSNYQDGWKVGPTKRMTLDEFKQWLETGARKPAVTSAENLAEPKAKPKKTKKPESKVSKAPESEPQPASSETKDQSDDAANEKSGDELADINLDDLADLIDAELGGAPQTHKPEKSRAKKTNRGGPRKTRSATESAKTKQDGERSATESLKSAGVNLSASGLEGLRGLRELFAPKNTLRSGLVFSEETYQKAKPHFKAMWADFQAAGKDIRDFIRAVIDLFGSGAKPFILRFAADYQAELKGETQNNQDERQAQISSADRVPVELANLENIRETLPTLLPEQQEDVAFVERRFKKPDGHGALITNGTGTGKTYSGLGVVKRYQRQGKNNILIITPSEAINNAWLRSAPDVGVTMRALVDTKDAGEGTVITTYANFYQNMELVHREWDLIVADEAHHLRRKDDLTPTKREHMLGALSYHPRFDMRRFEFIHREQYDERREVRASIHSKEAIRGLADTRDDQRQQLQREIDELKDRETAITGELTAAWEKARPEYAAKWEANTTQVLMLSATPFAYVKAVDMAEGYLFNYPEVGESSAYNAPGSQDAFFMGEFGFRKRYNKLTQPDAGVDRALMERQFNEKLKRDGVVRGRALEVEKDYDRKFIITPESSGITAGAEYDAAIDWIEEHKEELSEDRESVDYQAYELIQRLFERKRDYLQMVYMLEAMKAEAAIPYIEKHLALGRKVIVFHDYNKGGSRDPLRIQAAQSQAQELLKAAGDSATFEFENREYDTKAFRNAWKGFIKDNARIFDRELFYYPAPQTLFKNHFGDDALFFNGTVPSKQKMEAIRLFNQDGSGKNLLIAQLDAMQEGVSAHDTTGEHQRVLINIGLMNKPTAAIQTEGRIYRVGLKSDAAFRYPTTGLTLEDYLVSRSATRAGTAENLGMGEQARGLEESFRLAYESASYSEPNPKEGKGGKAADRKLAKVTTPFEIAKTRYYGSQKVTGRRNQREGEDFYPTPNPVGLKMVEWANLQPEERALEPSAGAGAILQWFPERVTAQFVEPFTGLYTKAQLKSPNAEHRPGSFEELDIRNKYDAIVMNPPFGQGGAKAFRHVTKALGHLSDGGRVVALVPKGPSADKAYGKFLEALPDNMFVRAEIALPASTFEKASTSILTQVLVIDRSDVEGASYNTKRVNFTGSDTVGELFDRLEEFDLSLPRAEKKPADEAPAVEGLAALDTTHGRTGEPLYVVELGQRLGDEEYSALSAKAKAAGGFPIKASFRKYYKGAAGIPAFDFRGDKGARDKFLAEAGAPKFSLGDAPASGMIKREAQSIADEVAAGWLGAPDTRVVQSIEQLPRKVYAHAARRGALSKLRAAYWESTLYIVADRMADRASVEKALLHEGFGHFGVRSVLGDGLEPYLNQVYLALGSSPEARRIRQAYFGSKFDANNRKHRLEVAEELIAHLAESGKHRKLWGRIVSFVRDRLRAMGFTLQINEADLLDLLRQAETVVKNGGISLAEGSPAMSLGGDHVDADFKATEKAYGGKQAWQKAKDDGRTKLSYRQWIQVRTAAFKRWFGDWESVALHNRIMGVAPIKVSAKHLKTEGSYKELRTEAVDSYKGPEEITNKETGEAIRVAKSGINNALQHGMNLQKRAVVSGLDQLLENAALVAVDSENMRQGVKAVETFASPVTIDSEAFVARLVVRELQDGRRFYDHELSAIESERPTGNSGGSQASFGSRQSEPQPSVSLGKRMLEQALAVNPSTVSKAVDPATGEPLASEVDKFGTDSDDIRFMLDPEEPRFKLLDAEERGRLEDPTAKGSLAARKELANRWYGSQPLDKAFRLPFHLFGGVNDQGEWVAGKSLSDNAERILTSAKFSPDSRFSWANPVLEKARMGLLDHYGLDPDYVERERQRGLQEREMMAQVPEIMRRLSEAGVGTAEAKVLQAILTGEEVGSSDMAKLAEPIRKSIDDMGAEAVQLGLLSAESFERNRGAYLHRVYEKHETGQDSLSRWVSKLANQRRRKIIGNQFKGRGMWIEVGVSKLMDRAPGFDSAERGTPIKGDKFRVLDLVQHAGQGKIDGFAEKKGGKVLDRVFLPADANIPDGLSGYADRGVWEVRGKKQGGIVLWRDFTKDERLKMGEIVDARYTIAKTYMQMAHDLSTGRFFRDIAQNPDWATASEPAPGTWREASEYKRFNPQLDVEWVKVPDTEIPKSKTKRYGSLAGMYVRAEIWRDMRELEVMQNPIFWTKMLTQWKLNKTARSPVVHMNNVMSNAVLMDLADVRAVDLVRGIRSMLNQDKHYQEAQKNGAFGTDMVAIELRRNVLQPLLEEIQRDMQGNKDSLQLRFGLVGKLADALWSGAKRVDRKMVNLYQLEDEVFRMATYVRKRSLGMQPQEAALEARDQFLNYDIRAPWVNAARRSVLPFIAYSYRAIPVVARSIALRPWKLAKYATVAYAANALMYALTGGDEDEERRSMREHEQGRSWIGAPKMMRTPMEDDYGNPVFLDVRRWVPAGDIFDMNQGQSALPVPSWLQFGGPLMLAAEFTLNKQAFTGKEIVNDKTDDIWDRTAKVADWAWKSWMPSAAYIPGSWYWERIGDAITGARDWQGRPYDLEHAAASSIGIKLKPQDVDDGRSRKGFEFNQIEEALSAEMRRLQADYKDGRVGQLWFEFRHRRLIEKMERLGRKKEETFTGEAAEP